RTEGSARRLFQESDRFRSSACRTLPITKEVAIVWTLRGRSVESLHLNRDDLLGRHETTSLLPNGTGGLADWSLARAADSFGTIGRCDSTADRCIGTGPARGLSAWRRHGGV